MPRQQWLRWWWLLGTKGPHRTLTATGSPGICPGRMDSANTRGGSWARPVFPPLPSRLALLLCTAARPCHERTGAGAVYQHPGDLMGNTGTSGQGRKGGFSSQPSTAKCLSPLTSPGSSRRCWVPTLIGISLVLVLRKSQKASGKVNSVQAELRANTLSSQMSSTGCRVTLHIQGRERAWSFVIDFLENCLCVWSRSVRSTGRAAFFSKWHLEGLNYFSGVEAFI